MSNSFESAGKNEYHLGSGSLPPTNEWLEALAGLSFGWLRALLTSADVVQGTSYVSNPLKRLFTPRPNQKVVVALSKSAGITSVSVYSATRSFGDHKADFKAMEITFDPSTKAISVVLFEDRTDSSVPLTFSFVYRPEQGFAPIHKVAEGRNTRIKEFYWRLWYGDNEVLPKVNIRDTFVGPEVTIDAATVERFCSVVGNQGEKFKQSRTEEVQAPMDFAIVTGWKVRFDLFSVLLRYTERIITIRL
jgi:fatty acid synthase subunit alpha